MDEKYKDCLLIELAKEIAEDIEVNEGVQPVGRITDIRHTCTNYDKLLERFSMESSLLSLECFWQGICTFDNSEGIGECPGKIEAYLIIKDAANNLAVRLKGESKI